MSEQEEKNHCGAELRIKGTWHEKTMAQENTTVRKVAVDVQRKVMGVGTYRILLGLSLRRAKLTSLLGQRCLKECAR
jgi:hypothetical protein